MLRAVSTHDFDELYANGNPTWEIGRPQRDVLALEQRGAIVDPVLDVGCGTGENALALAARGHDVVGVDAASAAIERARAKAESSGSSARFELADALELAALGRSFATVIDSAVFHVFDDDERARYVKSLAAVVRPGGRYFMLVFSDREPTDWGGPRRISRAEIEQAFADGWTIRAIEPARYETNKHEDGGLAWLAELERNA
ncbi:MAG: class I SAM-dependent methyltransferase [Deltaproteobacteria bacterium]|nr:class I SAM-dependent methyltransferase [Nannocystaceae bacterium]